MKTMTVPLPIEVPVSKYCSIDSEKCVSLAVCSDMVYCKRGLGKPVRTRQGDYRKPEECLDLELIQ